MSVFVPLSAVTDKGVAEPSEITPLIVTPVVELVVPNVSNVAAAVDPVTEPLMIPPSPPMVVSPASVMLDVKVLEIRKAPRFSEFPVPINLTPPAIDEGVVLMNS